MVVRYRYEIVFVWLTARAYVLDKVEYNSSVSTFHHSINVVIRIRRFHVIYIDLRYSYLPYAFVKNYFCSKYYFSRGRISLRACSISVNKVFYICFGIVIAVKVCVHTRHLWLLERHKSVSVPYYYVIRVFRVVLA